MCNVGLIICGYLKTHRGMVFKGKYYPFTTANGNTDFEPGIDLSKQTKDFQQRAKQGFSQQQMNAEVNKRANEQFQKVDEALKLYTAYPDTVSPQMERRIGRLTLAGRTVRNPLSKFA